MNIKHCRNGNELYGDNYHTRFQTNEYVISTQKNPLDHKSQNAYKIETSQNIYMEQGQVKTIEIKSLEANDAAQLRWNNGALVILDDTSENQNNSSADNKK